MSPVRPPNPIEANQPRAGRVPLIAYGAERRPAWLIEAMKPKTAAQAVVTTVSETTK